MDFSHISQHGWILINIPKQAKQNITLFRYTYVYMCMCVHDETKKRSGDKHKNVGQ